MLCITRLAVRSAYISKYSISICEKNFIYPSKYQTRPIRQKVEGMQSTVCKRPTLFVLSSF
jgi:hypothetical protein